MYEKKVKRKQKVRSTKVNSKGKHKVCLLEYHKNVKVAINNKSKA